MRTLLLTIMLLVVALSAGCATTRPTPGKSEMTAERQRFDADEVFGEAQVFFGDSAEGLGDVLETTFRDRGAPTAYIVGEEASGAMGVGVRFGKGQLRFKNGEAHDVYWQGASLGFDAGGNASKVFILVYDLHAASDLHQRFGGVEGTLYVVAGVGVNYATAGKITVAPVRAGVGWRAGANVGTLKFTAEETMNPL